MDLATTSVLEDCVEQLAVTGGQPVAWIIGIATVLLVAGGALLLLRSRRGRKALPALLLAGLVVVGVGWGPSVVSANAAEPNADCATQSQEVDTVTDSATPVPEDTTGTGDGGTDGGDSSGTDGGDSSGTDGGDSSGTDGGNENGNNGNGGDGNNSNGGGNENGNGNNGNNSNGGSNGNGNGGSNGNGNGNGTISCPEGSIPAGSECVPFDIDVCGEGSVMVDRECVPAPITCSLDEVAVDGVCVCPEGFARSEYAFCVPLDHCVSELYFDDRGEWVCRITPEA